MNLRVGSYEIEENANYPRGEGNLFLMTGESTGLGNRSPDRCIGGADQQPNRLWAVTIGSAYDEKTASAAIFIGEYETQHDAWLALWDSRYQAE